MKSKVLTTENWDEGLPLGNGLIGSIVYGGSPLKITVDRTDLWDLRPNETTLEKDFNFKNLIRLSKSGDKNDWAERSRLFEDILMAKPYPSKITAGRLEMSFDGIYNVSYILDYDNAIVDVYSGDKLLAHVFLESSQNVGIIKTYHDFSFALHVPTYLSSTPSGQSAIGDGADKMSLEYPNATFKEEDGFSWYEQNTHTDYSFGIVTYKRGGTLYYTLTTTDDDKDYISFAKNKLKCASNIGYEFVGETLTDSCENDCLYVSIIESRL